MLIATNLPARRPSDLGAEAPAYFGPRLVAQQAALAVLRLCSAPVPALARLHAAGLDESFLSSSLPIIGYIGNPL